MTSSREDAQRSARLNRILLPLQEFTRTEAAGGIVLMGAAVAAMIWANFATESYSEFWHEIITIDIGIFSSSTTLQHWVNDGLMVIFFFVVGLEIKRELLHGELAEPRKAALPAAAALGGMIVPATIYLSLNIGGDGEAGWGIPMATDIAFAVGVLAILGDRIPSSLRVFVLALAIVDDIGAILVIAIFYTDSLQWDSLAIAGLIIGVILAGQFVGINNAAVYLLLGLMLWGAIYESGVHATIAGVILGLLTPARAYMSRDSFADRNDELTREYRAAIAAGDDSRVEGVLGDIEENATDASSPLDRLERLLHPWSSFVVIPIFALANAGVYLRGGIVADSLTSSITIGVFLGLVIGKVVGVCGATWIATATRVAKLPEGVSWHHIFGASIVAGIGFTVSLFITDLAFDREDLINEAKVGITLASLLAGIAGYLYLRSTSRRGEADTP